MSTTRPLELVHIDLSGHMRVMSKGGKKYILVLVDDYSRYTWTAFLTSKEDTFEAFIGIIRRLEIKMGTKLASIRSDHGTEFDNVTFSEYCTSLGIDHNFSAPRSP